MTVNGTWCFAASRIAQARARRESSEPSTPTRIPGISAPQAPISSGSFSLEHVLKSNRKTGPMVPDMISRPDAIPAGRGGGIPRSIPGPKVRAWDGSLADGIARSACGDDRDPNDENQPGAGRRAEVVRWPGRPDPRRGQRWTVPLRVQPVRADQQVAHGTDPGQTAAESGSAQQADAGDPGYVAHHVQRAADQVGAGSGRGQGAGRGRGHRQRGGQPQERQPPATHAFWLAERASGGNGDGHGGPGLEDQRELQRAVAVPVPDEHDSQPDGTGRYHGQGGRDPPAGGVQPHQAHSRPSRPGPQRPVGHGCRRRRLAHPVGGHGSCARVIWPARSAARCRTSQACRAGAGNAANRWAAAKAGVPGASRLLAVTAVLGAGPCTGRPAAIISPAATACCAGDAPGPSPMTLATMSGPMVDRTSLANSLVVKVGPSCWSGRSMWYTGGVPLVVGPARPIPTPLLAPWL